MTAINRHVSVRVRLRSRQRALALKNGLSAQTPKRSVESEIKVINDLASNSRYYINIS